MTRKTPLLVALLALIALPATAFPAEPGEEIRTLVVEFNDAYLQNDLDRYFDFYSDDATLWFGSGRSTLASYRDGWYKLIEGGGAVTKNTVSDIMIQISPGGDAAIATYQLDVQTRYPDGRISNQHASETDVWFRTGDDWHIAHVHYTTDSGEE